MRIELIKEFLDIKYENLFTLIEVKNSPYMAITRWNSTDDVPDLVSLIDKLNDPTSEERKLIVRLRVDNYLSNTQSTFNAFFDGLMPATHQRLYTLQQEDVNHWILAGMDNESLPRSVIREWEVDKSQRLNSNGWIAVSAIIPFKCYSALDLFNTWRINTEFFTWLREEGKPLRSYIDAVIVGYNESDSLVDWIDNAETLSKQLATELSNLPKRYVMEILPTRISELDLQPVL